MIPALDSDPEQPDEGSESDSDAEPEAESDPLRESVAGKIPEGLNESVELVHRAQGGDGFALNALLARYESRLHRIVCVRLGAQLKQHVESVDIVQETFAVAFQKIDEFELRSHASIINWLARIAENKIRDANAYLFAGKRDKQRNQRLDAPGDTDSVPGLRIAADQTSVSERAIKSEMREVMDKAMTQMPDDYREVILFRDYSSADWEFVEQAMGRTKHACQELHRRAWIRLSSIVRGLLGEQ